MLDSTLDSYSRTLPYYLHTHNAFELHYPTCGSCVLRVGDVSYELHSGEICLITPGLYHSVKDMSDDFDRICLLFEILPLPEIGKLSDFDMLLKNYNTEGVFLFSADHLAWLLREMAETADEDGRVVGGWEKLRALTEVMIIELARNLHHVLSTIPSAPLVPDKPRIFLIDQFFHDHFQSEGGASELAELLNVSTRQLDRILKKLYGKGYRQKMLEVRLEVAKDFLVTTNKSIAEISELLGYTSPANFSTFFKSMTGIPPSAFR